MRKNYLFFSFAIIAIIFLQIFLIKSLYDKYIMAENEHIDDVIVQAIDLELLLRDSNNKRDIEFIRDIIPIYEMSQKMRDSIFAVNPPPKDPPKFRYDIPKLMEDGIITSSSEVTIHIKQDNYYENGMPIDINVLDSLLISRLKRSCEIRIAVRDSLGNILSEVENGDTEYNYISDVKQIGFKGYQFLQIEVFIPVASFIKRTVLVFVLTFIIILIQIICLMLLLTNIKKKTKQLDILEQSINGTIHDLKSPLIGVSSMLSWFNLVEKDTTKKETIVANMKGISKLVQKVESLLNIARDYKEKITIYKKSVSVDAIIEIIELTKQSLLLSYEHKNSIINICNRIPIDKILHIDIQHCDSIIRNLIENALKYSDDDVNINITLDIDIKNRLEITVADNGYGIGSKHIKYLFKQFYRVAHEGKDIKGYGIGLSYIKAIAIAHGGNISLKSTKGKGSEFEVKLNIGNK